jgi:hypothetical protein
VGILVSALTLAVAVVVGEMWLAWWAAGGGLWGVIAALLLAPLALLLAHRIWLFASLVLWDGGSIRQAKRRLHEAERSGRRFGVLQARIEVALLRHKRRA